MIVCLCRAVSDTQIKRVIAEGADTVREVARRCGAGTGCGACVPMVADMIDDAEARCGDCPRACAKLPSPYLANARAGEKAA
jgi:bacterioferritin-associated ferredoxin